MKDKNIYLWGSAPSLDGIKKVVGDFYVNDSMQLKQVSSYPKKWTISLPDKEPLKNVYVIVRGSRYRFEGLSETHPNYDLSAKEKTS